MKRDRRLHALALTLVSIGGLGAALAWWPAPQPLPLPGQAPEAAAPSNDHARQARAAEIRERFDQAVVMLHAKQYDFAIKALHRVLELSPRMPEAHANMGFALLGQGDYRAAADFFNTAISLNPRQVNAYYGLAEALEQRDDLEGALGAMRSYIHLSREDDPFVRKARAALWVWETELAQRRQAGTAQAATPTLATSRIDGGQHAAGTAQ